VVAVDFAEAGLALLRAEAECRGTTRRIEVVQADLEAAGAYVPEPARYDLVCDFYFLHRPLLGGLRAAVRPGGRLAAAIHVEDPSGAAPHRFLLAPGELKGIVERWGWDVLHWREGPSGEDGHQHATAEIVARKPA
jgi:SAM-dependent methyltransferase